MREGWVEDTLSNCIKLKSGNNLTAKNMISGEIPVYGGNGISGYHNDFNLNGENIIIGRVGAWCGNVRYVNERIWLTDNAFKISEYKYEFDYKFLTYMLNRINLRNYARQSAQPVISNSSIKDVLLKFPKSLPEQKQIVKTLDLAFGQIDQAKANLEQNLANAKELFASKLNEVFSQRGEGWEEKRLGDTSLLKIIDGDRGKNYPKKSDFSDTGYCVFLNTKNVRPQGFDFTSVMFITQERDNLLRKGKLQRDDVVMTTRGTIGNLGWYDNTIPYNNIRINSGMLIFRVNKEKVLPQFLLKLLQSPFMLKQIKDRTTGAAQPQLPIKTLVDFIIPIHSDLNEQKRMIKIIEDLETLQNKLIRIYQQNLNNLEELKKSILEKAFKGELV